MAEHDAELDQILENSRDAVRRSQQLIEQTDELLKPSRDAHRPRTHYASKLEGVATSPGAKFLQLDSQLALTFSSIASETAD
jgi:hypothetical protein